MGLTYRTLFDGEALLSGLADEPDANDVVAQVQFKAHGRAEQPRDLALFLPMTVVATLRDCRAAPTHAQPFLDICGELADALLGWTPAAGPFSLRGAVSGPSLSQEDIAYIYGGERVNEEMLDSWLRQCLPRVSDDGASGHRRRFKAELREPRRAGGIPFVAMSNRNRNPFLEIVGTLAMFGAAAQSRDYHGTIRPTAATLKRMLDFNADVFGAGIPEFSEATWLYQLVMAVSTAEDPLTGPLPQFFGTDTAGEETVMMTKLGRWARETGLDESAAAQELVRRMDAGEPMPWEQP
jgi:hypothetical protein